MKNERGYRIKGTVKEKLKGIYKKKPEKLRR